MTVKPLPGPRTPRRREDEHVLDDVDGAPVDHVTAAPALEMTMTGFAILSTQLQLAGGVR